MQTEDLPTCPQKARNKDTSGGGGCTQNFMVDAQSYHRWHVRTRTWVWGVRDLPQASEPPLRSGFYLSYVLLYLTSCFSTLGFSSWNGNFGFAAKSLKSVFGFFASDWLVTRSSSSLIRNPIWGVAKSSLIFFHRNHQCPSTYFDRLLIMSIFVKRYFVWKVRMSD